MSRNFKRICQYFICYRSEKTPCTNFAFNLRTSTSKTPNLRARVYTIETRKLTIDARLGTSYELYELDDDYH